MRASSSYWQPDVWCIPWGFSAFPHGMPVPILAEFSLNDRELGSDDRDNPKAAQLGWDQDSLLAMVTSRLHCFAAGDSSSTSEESGVIVNRYWIYYERVAVKMRNTGRIWHFLLIPLGIKCPTYGCKVQLAVVGDASPHHHWVTAKWFRFLNRLVIESFAP